MVVPVLRGRDLVRERYEGTTLRENLFEEEGRTRLADDHPARR